ncbi:MAG TPA: tetratricopeptide repeat protein [Sphingomicrobium sp.]|nr:tetratricopeptide repeat protein [Sphingomicrobium sp.]
MSGIVRPLVLILAAGTLMSAGQPFSHQPGPLSTLHGDAMRHPGSHSMRAMIMASAAVVQQNEIAAAPLYDGLGKVHVPVTTANPRAQRYFDQGLGFAYGFNHAAAIAAFREAQRLDPNCAMCFWGEAFAYGPNINAPMEPESNARAVGLARYADWLAIKATPEERALTGAMFKRYSPDLGADRAKLDADYADAMLAAAGAHPSSDSIALIAAEAAMDTRPWDYWSADKQPNPRIGEAVRLVETVLARNPEHPQGAHLYIHLMENGPDPKRAEAAADRLATPLSPTAGHLVHMPAHIYYRVGRWKDSIRVNVDAARADEAYLKASGDKGLYRYGYYPHNVHFIVTSAQMSGDMRTAIREARRLGTILDPATSAKIAWIQAINAAPYFAAAQFETPARILAMPKADARMPYIVGMRHYARATAYALQRNRAGFDREIGQLARLREHDDFKAMIDQGVPAPQLLQLAETVARGRFAMFGGRYDDAVRLYGDAAAQEAKIPYMEPPFWYYPVRQSLGAALYKAGKYAEAREAFTKALEQSPNNGWVLYGLAATNRATGLKAEAEAADAALKRAWAGDPRWLRMERL